MLSQWVVFPVPGEQFGQWVLFPVCGTSWVNGMFSLCLRRARSIGTVPCDDILWDKLGQRAKFTVPERDANVSVCLHCKCRDKKVISPSLGML